MAPEMDPDPDIKIKTAFKKGHADPEEEKEMSTLQKLARYCQLGVIGGLERFYTWYGEHVAKYPRTAIAICVVATIIGGLGLVRFHEEGDAASLVIPRNSKFRKDMDWLDENFPREIRVHSVVYEAANVLTPEVIQAVYNQRKLLQKMTLGDKSFPDMCIKVPILKFPDGGFEPEVTIKPFEDDWYNWDDDQQLPQTPINKTSSNSGGGIGALLSAIFAAAGDISINTLQQWSNDFYPDPYCAAVEATEMACFELNLVELWANKGVYDEVSDERIASLTQAEILDTVNHRNVSQIFLKEKDFTSMLGKISYNEQGDIIGAGALEIKFYTTVNVTAVKLFGTASRGEKIDHFSYEFEGAMSQLLQNKSSFPEGLNSYVNVQRQFFESFVGQTFKDADKLAMGYALVFVYVNCMLSKMNFVEQRMWLSVAGILSVVMGMTLSYGLCSMFGLFYSAAHTVIPFLLLGIGIDNIFVITQAYNTFERSSVPLTLGKRFGQTMGHAGVAVSVTTFTDVIAFFVGSNTVLPGLESFCIYAAVSIFFIYLMQVTHFVAWMSLDQRRINSQRDGCFCCIKHNKPNQSYIAKKGSVLNKVFLKLGHLIVRCLFKVVIITIAIVLLVFGIWGTLNLDQEYQPEWLLPPESEVSKWFVSKSIYFPSAGEPGYIMIRQIDIPKELDTMDRLVKELRNQDKIIDWVNTWHEDFIDYVNQFKASDKSFYELMKDEEYFRNKFTQFLFSPKGAIYQANFFFSEKLVCGKPAPDVLLQAIPFSHLRFDRSADWIPAMYEVERIVDSIKFSNYSFPIALTYINWKTDAVVGTELLRNVGIAMICIFVTTLTSLGSWRGSMLVMLCVLLTCVDVSGFMHWWGLSIDIFTMNLIIISVGLCVDYCAHIVHGFLTSSGSRENRVLFVMENIAPAVMNGGFSTIVALSLLVTSQSHVFIAFFKIFFMICMFGLFHGLVVLPVILTLIGPAGQNAKASQVSEMMYAHNGVEMRKENKKASKENKKNKAAEKEDLEVVVGCGCCSSPNGGGDNSPNLFQSNAGTNAHPCQQEICIHRDQLDQSAEASPHHQHLPDNYQQEDSVATATTTRKSPLMATLAMLSRIFGDGEGRKKLSSPPQQMIMMPDKNGHHQPLHQNGVHLDQPEAADDQSEYAPLPAEDSDSAAGREDRFQTRLNDIKEEDEEEAALEEEENANIGAETRQLLGGQKLPDKASGGSRNSLHDDLEADLDLGSDFESQRGSISSQSSIKGGACRLQELDEALL